ncbi:MAG: DNA repair protein RecN [Actinobacteria bacterium]|jgi:DNA repair protein RecN (Recombination protein N)|nr:DNA repair protein RecN [Actinomycetota bacterium]MCL5886170.1 DNA repair protein RecN [Actinomycetota bacterium]
MLIELNVQNLGVLDDVAIQFQGGMTVITGETGAGKTLIVEALGLLCGGRADSSLVRSGASEATIEGRFVTEKEDEVVVSRQISSNGRSRAWVNGRMYTASGLIDITEGLVDIYSQHTHHSLLSHTTQRDMLDMYGEVDLTELTAARQELRDIERRLEDIEGGSMTVEHEIELHKSQLDELNRASLNDPNEYDTLGIEERRLSDVESIHDKLFELAAYMEGDSNVHDDSVQGGAITMIGYALSALKGTSSFGDIFDGIEKRLKALHAEAQDIAATLNDELQSLVFDPSRLDEIRIRRLALRELIKRYSDDGSLGSVIVKRDSLQTSLDDLADRSKRIDALRVTRDHIQVRIGQCEEKVREQRAESAVRLAQAVEQELASLAMEKAVFSVKVGDSGAGEPIEFGLGANPGEPVLPVAKVASGGELARTMLAIRLAFARSIKYGPTATGTIPTSMVFDEVDAGIGGEAALSVGNAIYELSKNRQVLVVTHLPQVAAFADNHIQVMKNISDARTSSSFNSITGQERVEEIARMLSGQPDLKIARDHAREILDRVGK